MPLEALAERGDVARRAQRAADGHRQFFINARSDLSVDRALELEAQRSAEQTRAGEAGRWGVALEGGGRVPHMLWVDPGFRRHLLELRERHTRALERRQRLAVLQLRGTLEDAGDLLIVEPASRLDGIRHGPPI